MGGHDLSIKEFDISAREDGVGPGQIAREGDEGEKTKIARGSSFLRAFDARGRV